MKVLGTWRTVIAADTGEMVGSEFHWDQDIPAGFTDSLPESAVRAIESVWETEFPGCRCSGDGYASLQYAEEAELAGDAPAGTVARALARMESCERAEAGIMAQYEPVSCANGRHLGWIQTDLGAARR